MGGWSLVNVETDTGRDTTRYIDKIYRTEDGLTFTPVTSDVPMGAGYTLASDGAGTYLMLTNPSNFGEEENPVFFVSTDAGKSWQSSDPGAGTSAAPWHDFDTVELDFANGRWFAVANAVQAYTSTDASTWTAAGTIPVPSGVTFYRTQGMVWTGSRWVALLWGRDDATSVYVIYASSSDESGATWTMPTRIAIASSPAVTLIPRGFRFFGGAVLVWVVEWTPSMSSGVHVYGSTDNGATWSSHGYTNIPFYSSVFEFQEQLIAGGNNLLPEIPNVGPIYSDDGVTWTRAAADPSDALPFIAEAEINSDFGSNGDYVWRVRSSSPIIMGPTVTWDFTDPNTPIDGNGSDSGLTSSNMYRVNPVRQRLELQWRDSIPREVTFTARGVTTRNIEKFDVTATMGADYGEYGHAIWYAAGQGMLDTDQANVGVPGIQPPIATNAGYRWDDSGHLRRWYGTGLYDEYNTPSNPDPYEGTTYTTFQQDLTGHWDTIGTFPPLVSGHAASLLSAAQSNMVISASDGWKVDAVNRTFDSVAHLYWGAYTTLEYDDLWSAEGDGYGYQALHLRNRDYTAPSGMYAAARTTGSFAVTPGSPYTVFLAARAGYDAGSREQVINYPYGTLSGRFLPTVAAFLVYVNAAGADVALSTKVALPSGSYVSWADDICGTVTVPTGLGIVGAYLLVTGSAPMSFDKVKVYPGTLTPASATVRVKFDSSTGIHEVFYDGVSQGTCFDPHPIKAADHTFAGVAIRRVCPDFEYEPGGGFVPRNQPNWIDNVVFREVIQPWMGMRIEGGPELWEQTHPTLNYELGGYPAYDSYAWVVGNAQSALAYDSGPSAVHFW